MTTIFLNIKGYYKAMITEIVWYQKKIGHKYHWNVIKNSEVNFTL